MKAVIVDDELPARELIRNLLEGDPDVSVVAECGDVKSAVAALLTERPDILFLDILMPDGHGFSILNQISDRSRPIVVFVTAYEKFAVRAFDESALDYVLKPVSAVRFREALARAKARALEQGRGPGLPRLKELMAYWSYAGKPAEDREDGDSRPYLRRIPVRLGDVTRFIDVESVAWIRSADHFVELHVEHGVHLASLSISTLERKLDPARFVRIHRTSIVNSDSVAELRHGRQLQLVLKDGTRLRVSAARRDLILGLLARARLE